MVTATSFVALVSMGDCSRLVGGLVASAGPLNSFREIDKSPQSNADDGVDLEDLFEDHNSTAKPMHAEAETASAFKVGP